MKKRLWVFAVALITSGYVQADGPSGKALLKSKLDSLQAFSASFKQTILDEGEVLGNSTGTLILQRPNKMRWETQSPEENLIIADGDSIWNIDSFVEQVTVFPQQDTVRNNPIMLLTTKDASIWDRFSVIQLEMPKGQVDVAYNTVFEITALDQDAQITQLKLRFKDDELTGLSTIDSQQQISDMAFSDIQVNSVVGAEIFAASFPESYTIDDQR